MKIRTLCQNYSNSSQIILDLRCLRSISRRGLALVHLDLDFSDSSSTIRYTIDLPTNQSSTLFPLYRQSFSSLHSELSHLSDFFSSSIDSVSSKLEPLTISGLLPIIETHGSNSNEYQGALDSLSKILSGGIQSLQSQVDEKNLKIALILSPQESDSSSKAKKRSLEQDSSDEELMKRYFEPRQYQVAQPSTLVGSEKKEEPKSDRELIRSCFKSQKELESASADCSGNGKGKESQIGGEMCWRCSCKSSWVSFLKISPFSSFATCLLIEPNSLFFYLAFPISNDSFQAGESCSRKDISAQFLLLGGSGLVLVLVALGSLYVLAAEGSKELPGVLAGIQVPTLTRN